MVDIYKLIDMTVDKWTVPHLPDMLNGISYEKKKKVDIKQENSLFYGSLK